MNEDEAIDPANMTVQKLAQLHRTEIFPTLFNELTFDMVAEMEFEIEKKGKVFYVTSSDFWMTPDRLEGGHFQIRFEKEAAREYGKLVDSKMINLVRKRNDSFKIGYTQDLARVNNNPKYKQVVSVPAHCH